MKKLCLTLALLLGTISYVNAEETEFNPGLYLGIDLGYATVKDQTQETADLMVKTLGGRATVTQDAGLGLARILAGFKIIENLDLEIGYFKSSEQHMNAEGTAWNGGNYTIKATSVSSGFDYSLLLRPSLSTGINCLFIRAGGHSSQEEGKVITKVYNIDVASETVTVKGSGFLYGLGYDEYFGEHFALRGEFTRYEKIAGVSDNYANLFHIALIGKF
ncbi:MAG: hypothetical protein QM523_03885 [Candidatus Pacebacteria bacterium]|nr:hypothetical protein [Candidatus Paceibacterota bacterium]